MCAMIHDFCVYESVARGHDELLGSSHPETLKTLGILAELLQDTEASQSQNVKFHLPHQQRGP